MFAVPDPANRKPFVEEHRKKALADPEGTKFFDVKSEADAVADAITNAPRKGVATVRFYAFYDAYVVEHRPRKKPYSNPALLRNNGEFVKYV